MGIFAVNRNVKETGTFLAMISVGNRDGRKGIEQGFTTSKRDMDETELEEGEACSYQDHDEDAGIDPDIALSYIDEKLQNVLGHFQKDFEGVVSAENLGAKYGIYGSFLPAYRRSPVWSHSRSPQRVQSHNTPQSPNLLLVEGGNQASLAHTSAPHSLKHGSASTCSTSSYANKPSSQSSLYRLTTKMQSMQSLGDSTPKSEARDQKTLKVRIKVGSDNLSVKKSAAIYSGLGLDGSPSSSFDDSPMEGEGLSYRLAIHPHESPTQILQMMTSFPICGSSLLSPLPDDMIQLIDRPELFKDILTHSSSKTNLEYSVVGLPCYSVKENKTIYGKNGVKLFDRNALKVKREGENIRTDFDSSMKESDIDAACEELVSNALKLPLLSDTYSTMGETVKDSLKKKVCDAAKREPSESFSIPVSLTDRSNAKAYRTGNVVDCRLLDIPDERISYPRKVRDGKGEATSSTNTDTVGLKLKKTSKGGLKDPGKQKADKTSSSGNKQLFSVDKKKSKKSQVLSSASKNAAMDGAHDHARVLKNKDSDVEAHACTGELKSSPLQRELSKASDKYSKTNDTYKDFFGDINELEADIVDSPDVPSGDRLKTSAVVEKATLANEIAFKERTSTLEAHKGVISGTDLKRSSHSAILSENGRPMSDPAPAGADSKDSWVCCDKCQAWRLLPPGSKVDSLPEKWDCSMLTWLPGLNRCGISDEETTKAVRAHYQLLAENSNSVHVPPDRPATGIITADKFDPAMLNDEKMIDKLRKISKPSFQDSPHRPPSSSKKKQRSAKERSSAEVKESPVTNIPDFLQQSKSSDTYGEINKRKKMDKHRGHCDSGGGHAKISNKTERDEECPKASKRTKKQIIQSEDNEGATAEYQGNDMMTVSSGFGLATNSALKDKMTSSEFFSPRKSKDDKDGDSLDTSDKLKIHLGGFPDVASLHVKKSDSGTLSPKKRKMDNFQDPASSTPSSGKLVLDHDEQRRKKHRISKSGGKESSTSKRNGKAEKRSKSVSQRSLNDTEPLLKGSSCAPPALAATSSSSKVSGCLKAKSKFQELKGSPVESVSSSPFRISNSDKLTSGRKIMVEKESVKDVKLATGSSVKCSDDDYQGGGSQSGLIRKDNSLDPGEQTTDRCVNEATGDDGDHNITVSHSEKFWKESSLLCKDRNTTSNSDKGKVNTSESYNNPCDNGPVYGEKKREGKIKAPEKFESNVDEIEKDFLSNKQEPFDLKSKAQQGYDQKRSSKKFDVGKSEQLVSISSREKSNLPASDRQKNEKSDSLRSKQGNGMHACSSAARVNDLPKESNSDTKVDTQNGMCHIPSRQPISNGHRIKNQDAPSPLRRDAASQAAGNAIKEAKNLKHLADRLKQAAGSTESTGYYFEAALKFLHGASLLESGKTENTKHGDTLQSIKIYSDTAKLCEFCAHEYEKCKDMATAALAYKCMEVAYLRVIYSSHHSASRDRHELQTVLQMVPPGESPSSSASDIDNLNNSSTMDKDLQGRNDGSPQLATNLVIAAKNRPTFKRLLSFAQDVNFAMEASRKSRMAFAAANVKMDQEDSKDVIASLKRALDFNFHDVQGLLRLVRLAKEATSR